MEYPYDNTSQIDSIEENPKHGFYEPTDNDKELLGFIVDHTDRWRDYRDQNFRDDWEKYERIFRGVWDASDKTRKSERSRIISPATQQAIETSHAECMEAIFGQGEYFDIKDDLADKNGSVDVEQLKNQLYEDFAQDKIRKSIDQIALMGKIYGTGIGEIAVSKSKYYYPMTIQTSGNQAIYGTGEKDRVCVKLVPVNPKNFLFDPNGDSVDDCMGVAIERYVSVHKVVAGIMSGKYRKVNINTLWKDDSLEPSIETRNFQDDKVLMMTYYGLVPKEYLSKKEEKDDSSELSESVEDYEDMVEAVIVIANGSVLLKAEESPYMMKDRPVLTYQDDTVPNRLLGRGVAEKAFNMQCAIDGSMRAHLDGLALTSAPMMGLDATRIPRGGNFQVKPGGNFLVNGNPAEILYPFKFGVSDGQSMETSKEFERMLLMATATIDSNGSISPVSRDGQMDMATATMIKKYKRMLVNFQEDFLIPFIKKAAWRYMQYEPERYPSVDVKFIPTATLGIIAREYEQKQMAFLIQTLGAQSPLTPVLMQGLLKNSSLSNREQMIEQMAKQSQPDPAQQQMQQQAVVLENQTKQAELAKTQAETQQIQVETSILPQESRAKLVAALSTNINTDAQEVEFERRVQIANLMLKEKDITSNENIAKMQMTKSVDAGGGA